MPKKTAVTDGSGTCLMVGKAMRAVVEKAEGFRYPRLVPRIRVPGEMDLARRRGRPQMSEKVLRCAPSSAPSSR